MVQLLVAPTTTITEPTVTTRLLAGMHNNNVHRRLLAATSHLAVEPPPDHGDQGLASLVRTLRNPETTTAMASTAALAWLLQLQLDTPLAANGTTRLVAYALAHGEGTHVVPAYTAWHMASQGRCVAAWVHSFFATTCGY